MTLTPEATETTALQRQLADPEVQANLSALLQHADLLAVLVEGLDQFVSRSDVIGDSLLASIHELRATTQGGTDTGSPLDVKALADAGKSLAGKLPELLDVAEVASAALPQVEVLARGLADGSSRFPRDAVQVSGPVSALKLLKDPDINRAISFFATVAQSIGRELAKSPR